MNEKFGAENSGLGRGSALMKGPVLLQKPRLDGEQVQRSANAVIV